MIGLVTGASTGEGEGLFLPRVALYCTDCSATAVSFMNLGEGAALAALPVRGEDLLVGAAMAMGGAVVFLGMKTETESLRI
jgi:hypothetical protein